MKLNNPFLPLSTPWPARASPISASWPPESSFVEWRLGNHNMSRAYRDFVRALFDTVCRGFCRGSIPENPRHGTREPYNNAIGPSTSTGRRKRNPNLKL